MSNGITTLGEITSNDILAGSHPVIEVKGIPIASGQTLKRGAMLGLQDTGEGADSKYHLYDDTATDGTENLAGILAGDVDASLADGIGTMYVHGEFLKSGLTAAETATISAGVFGMIVIKDED